MDGKDMTAHGGHRAWKVTVGGKPGWVAKGWRGILKRTFATEEKALEAAHDDDEELAQELAWAEGEHWKGYGIDAGRDGFVIAYNPQADEVARVIYALGEAASVQELIERLDLDFPLGSGDAPTPPSNPFQP